MQQSERFRQMLSESESSVASLIPRYNGFPFLPNSFALQNDPTGFGVPPFRSNYALLGGYRPLYNIYSDGTPYPLDMSKFDYYGEKGGESSARATSTSSTSSTSTTATTATTATTSPQAEDSATQV